MKKMKKFLAMAMIFGMAGFAFANGLSLNSIGTKSMGMGGAYVGYANDATAIYWNPAGLAGQKTHLLFFADDIIPSAGYTNDLAGIDATMIQNHYIAPNLFFNYNMDKMAFGLGIYVPAGLGAEWDTDEFGYTGLDLELMSKVAAISISPTFAYQVSDQFSVGVSLNIIYAMFDMKQPADDPSGLTTQPAYQYAEESTGLGYGATIGLLYDINEMFSVGATVRLATAVAMEGEATNGLFPAFPTIPGVIAPGPGKSDFDREVTWPLWVGGGIAYRPMENLTVTFDAQYSQWSELQVLDTKYKDPYWQAVLEPDGSDDLELKWEDAVQIRVGGEYYTSEALALRLGYYYDPAPSPDETLTPLFPSATYNAVTGGLSYFTGNWTIDFAAEYLIGGDREVKTEVAPGVVMTEVHSISIFALSLGASYAF
jgi:long-chain fatty acid transport protein